MKKISGYFFVACLFATVLAFSSCSKDGSAGPAGPAGAAGAAGSKGDKGDQGDPGTANIIYSDWLDVTYGQDTTGQFIAQIDAPKLDANILSTGLVKIYMNFGTADDPAIVTIPYVESAGVVIRDISFVGGIGLISNVDASTLVADDGSKIYQVRYVLVPGGVAARQATIDWNNYAKVKAYLHLKN